MMMADLKMKRSHMELSGKSLSFIKKQADIIPHLHSFASAAKFHASRGDTITHPTDDDKEVVRHPELKDHMYVRSIGGYEHTKVMMGKLGNTITEATTRTKEQELAWGAGSALKPGVHEYGKWKMDTQIHGPSQARDRQPDWKSEDWHDFLHRSHEALTNPSKHLSKPSKLTHNAVLVYSKKKQQGVVLRIAPHDNNNPKQGGTTRIETVLPHKSSIAQEGTQRIVIEGLEFEEGINFHIID